MTHSIPSQAFRQATLRSERFRTLGLLVIITACILLNITRTFFGPFSADNIRRGIEYSSFWLICGIYETFILFLIARAQRHQRPLRPWAPFLNTFIECVFPTIGALGLTVDRTYLGPYLALQSGILIIYCFFIILSTLRLSPALCILAGTVSSAGYFAVYLFTRWAFSENHNRSVFPEVTFIIAPVFLFGAGLVAAAVARQIRQHVIAALQEAETRRKLDHIEHDLQIARSIQMGLLPKNPPAIPGYDIAGWSQPADQTGGDYYDWIQLPGGGADKTLFTIADATGHGIGPALLVAACRAYFRALASHTDPLESITRQVDSLLAKDVTDGRFITAAIALLDPQSHQLLLYSAGHAPLYLYTAATHKVTQFDSNQPPLGIDMPLPPDPSDPDRLTRALPLAPGDAVILVTDGFFECANPSGDLLGTDRLADAIRQHHALPAKTLIQTLYQDVLTFSQGTPQSDDLTAVIIKRQTDSTA